MALPQPQTPDQRSEIEQRYGQFYTKADEDEITCRNLKARLGQVQAIIFDTKESTLEDSKFAVLGILIQIRQFLFGYKDALKGDNLKIMEELDDTIDAIRLTDLDRENINEIYRPVNEHASYILSVVLGFRKKKVANYSWVEKLHERMQLKNNEKTQAILADAKSKKKIS